MALTRKALTAMGIEDAQIEQIIEMHSETVTGLKDEIDQYKADAERLPAIQKELDELKENAAKDSGEDTYKVKYEAIKEEFEQYKADEIAKATQATKEKVFRGLLQSAGVADKRIESVVKVSGSVIDGIELDEEGHATKADELTEAIKNEWSDFIPTTHQEGAQTATPPQNTGGSKLTKEDIKAIKNPVERQKAIAENIELYK